MTKSGLLIGLLVLFLTNSGLTDAKTVTQRASTDDPTSVTQRDVRIEAGEVTLAGTLYRPAKVRGNLAAVVIVHGSGPVTREKAGFWVNTALQIGELAVLVFDKRGIGDSTGMYRPWSVGTTQQMFDELAADVESAARWLSAQPGVDAKRIGLMGGSQAGWIMPLAASREPLIRYLVIGEGVPLAAGIEEVHSTYVDSVVNGAARPTLRQINAADLLAEDYAGERGFDPAPILEASTIPMLWTFGLYDEAIPTRLSIDRIGALQRMGKGNLDIHIFAFGDHNFRHVYGGERYDLAAVARDWLTKIGIFDRQ